MRRLPALLSVVVLLGLLAPAVAVGQEATPGPGAEAGARTDIRFLAPFGPEGLNPGLTVTGNVTGSCSGGAVAVPDRADAFGCLGEGFQVFDPCFENPSAPIDEPGELACVADPFASEVVLLAVEGPLPREKDAPAGQEAFQPWDLPWALELANGDRCTLFHGTLTMLAGQTVYYSCEQNGAILGPVERQRPVWTVNYLADGDVASSLVDVAAAWS